MGNLVGNYLTRQSSLHRLSPAFVRNCTAPGVYLGGGGLRFRVMANGSRAWVMRIAIRGVSRDISLGPLAAVSLAQARETASGIRRAVTEGRDPVDERRAARKPPEPVAVVEIIDDRPTFEGCWRTHRQVKERQLSNGKHRDQWESTLRTYVLPQIGNRPIADIRPSKIIDLLKPIWTTKEETALRVLQRIDAIFVSAIDRSAWLPTIATPSVRFVRFSAKQMTEGVARHMIDGVSVTVTSAARTVVDCFRYRGKVGMDVALEGLREGLRGRHFTADDLWHIATTLRAWTVMRPYVEALVSDGR